MQITARNELHTMVKIGSMKNTSTEITENGREEHKSSLKLVYESVSA